MAGPLGTRALQLVEESASRRARSWYHGAGRFRLCARFGRPIYRRSTTRALSDWLLDCPRVPQRPPAGSSTPPTWRSSKRCASPSDRPCPSQRFSVEDVKRFVHVRFPGVGGVPGRPGLDRVLAEAGTGLTWDGESYSIPSAHSDTTFVTQTSYPAVPIRTMEAAGHPASNTLRKSIGARSFLALGVPAKHAERLAAGLVSTFGATEVNVSDVLLDSLKESAEKAGVPWETVLAADAAKPGSVDARRSGCAR